MAMMAASPPEPLGAIGGGTPRHLLAAYIRAALTNIAVANAFLTCKVIVQSAAQSGHLRAQALDILSYVLF